MFKTFFKHWQVAGALLLSLLCSANSRGDILIQDGQTLAFLGDSITAFGWQKPGGYVNLVVAGLAAEGVKVTPIPAGISGNTSRDMLRRLDKDVLSKKPQWMTLSCGVNDVWHGTTGVKLDQYKKNIADIVDQATAAGIKVVILTSTPIMEDETNDNNKLLASYNDYLRQLAKDKNLPLADLADAFQKALAAGIEVHGTNQLTVDGVHMNPAGNMLMASTILKAFGVPDSDFPKVDAAWDTIPNGAIVDIAWRAPAAPLTIGEYRTLESAAKAKQTNPAALANRIFVDALRDVITKHNDEMPVMIDQIQAEAQKLFEERVKDLAAVPK